MSVQTENVVNWMDGNDINTDIRGLQRMMGQNPADWRSLIVLKCHHEN